MHEGCRICYLHKIFTCKTLLCCLNIFKSFMSFYNLHDTLMRSNYFSGVLDKLRRGLEFIKHAIIQLYCLTIVTTKNIVWKLWRGYCLCYCKTFRWCQASLSAQKSYITEECSIAFVLIEIK